MTSPGSPALARSRPAPSTFTWYNNSTCSSAAAPGIAAGTVALDGTGIAHPSNDEILTASGGSFSAHYNGDATYNPSDGACEPLTVTTKLNTRS